VETYLEIHKANDMRDTIRGVMNLLDKVNMNFLIKSSVKTDLNKCLQYLSLKGLKTKEVI
jgi:hypothetical protein